MTIYREINGVRTEFVLNIMELQMANAEWEHICHMEDARDLALNRNVELTEEELEDAAWRIEGNLGRNDAYWDCFWESAVLAVEEVINEREEEEE